MSFFSEFKRRKMAQVAFTYAVTGWLLLQLCAILLPTFNATKKMNPRIHHLNQQAGERN